MKVKPMLGDWEVPHIEEIGSLERRTFVEHQVPGQTQSLYQDMSSTPTRVAIMGSLYGDEDRDAFLQEVRAQVPAPASRSRSSPTSSPQPSCSTS